MNYDELDVTVKTALKDNCRKLADSIVNGRDCDVEDNLQALICMLGAFEYYVSSRVFKEFYDTLDEDVRNMLDPPPIQIEYCDDGVVITIDRDSNAYEHLYRLGVEANMYSLEMGGMPLYQIVNLAKQQVNNA